MNKRLGTLIASLGIVTVAATLSAGQLPHTGPGGRPGGRQLPPGSCTWTTRCAPAPVPCGTNPRQSSCRGSGGQLPPTGRGGR
jgi:hypothetical protein